MEYSRRMFADHLVIKLGQRQTVTNASELLMNQRSGETADSAVNERSEFSCEAYDLRRDMMRRIVEGRGT